MAEREGFEPSIEFPLYTLSKRAPSTTRPSLLVDCFLRITWGREVPLRRSRSEGDLHHVAAIPGRRRSPRGSRDWCILRFGLISRIQHIHETRREFGRADEIFNRKR